MKLFLDENIPRSALQALIELGFDVEHASEVGLRGASDRKIAEYAKKPNAILVTKDPGFGSLLVHPKGFLQQIESKELAGRIITLERGRYRIRDTG